MIPLPQNVEDWPPEWRELYEERAGIIEDVRGVAMTRTCGQQERDLEMLRKFAEKYAVMALVNLPDDYESRKRIITNAIIAALTNA